MDVQEFDIANVAALDVDVNENKLYWIDSVEKVGAPITRSLHNIIALLGIIISADTIVVVT